MLNAGTHIADRLFAVERRSNAGIVTERQLEKRPRDAEGRQLIAAL